ncbi:type II toxin-antitoxin system VapC family toxin [Aureimonas psammosilenae]|uniref:type II toxin-antitoxin system VapC family toxin n=1 Tax=Aureimonas psammosilenae TaxID=2495496 RepID=UPI001260ED2D|nr:type II toxin-antitoxin system VapC family toxin [Aureimonas psammosilenae]
MKIVADTNVLLRAFLPDEGQQKAALEALASAETVAVSVHSLCEFAWVLGRSYGAKKKQVATSIRMLLDTGNVVVDRPIVDAGLAVLDAGGDFADGVIAFDGRWLGADTFVSFDRKAVRLLEQQGVAARLLA